MLPLSTHSKHLTPHLNVLPHGVDDGGPGGRVHTEQSSQAVNQFVLCRFVIEGEDDGGPGGDVARATHLQGGVGGGET